MTSLAVEGCTGWRYVVEELAAAGVAAHLAEPSPARRHQAPAEPVSKPGTHAADLL